MFNYSFVYDKKVCHTLTASCEQVLFDEPRYLSNTEMRLISSWPLDYKMPEHKVNFICGMSVPPLMAYRLAQEVKKQ